MASAILLLNPWVLIARIGCHVGLILLELALDVLWLLLLVVLFAELTNLFDLAFASVQGDIHKLNRLRCRVLIWILLTDLLQRALLSMNGLIFKIIFVFDLLLILFVGIIHLELLILLCDYLAAILNSWFWLNRTLIVRDRALRSTLGSTSELIVEINDSART